MPRFEGCKEAKEISLVRRGANQHAHVLVRKHAASTPDAVQPQPETTQMTDAEKKAAAEAQAAEVRKIALAQTNKIAAMSDVTKGYYLGLDETAQLAFLEKSAEDQAKEAETAKAAAEQKKLEEEAAKSGKTPQLLDLEKRFEAQRQELDAMKAAQVDRDLEKRAETEFAGFPGGTAKLVPLLKAYAKLDPEARTASEEMLKAQAKLARESTIARGGRTEEDVSKADASKTRIETATQELMKSASLSHADAWERIIEKREFAEDVAALG